MNGLSLFQIKVHNKYSAADFDEDLRIILRRAGCKGEKICFIMDESNVLDSGFLERMNTLLANAEIPGLFEGDEYASLMSQCKEAAQREGLMLDSGEELYKWFTHQVMKNLHIVFTMNPPEGGLASRAATSPALFNRCVLDWFGDWSDQAFYQVGKEFTDTLDLDLPTFVAPRQFPVAYRDLIVPPTYREAIVNAFVFIHQSLYEINRKLTQRYGRSYHVTPRHYLDFINHFVKLYFEKREDLEEQQRHLNIGLEKLRDTVLKVEELRRSLAIKKAELELKNDQANEKLKKMVADQQEAEQQKSSSLRIQENLSKQNVLIEERKRIVMSDLADAEPAVAEAQKSVSNIKKQHLTEVRAMGNPPEAVKIAMESVCILLGHKIDSWKTVQAILRKDDFIASIVNYDTDKMTQRIRDEIRNTYLTNPTFNFEAVNRASKACGPLVQWVIAQVRYAEILEKVGPLRQEVQELETSAEKTKEQAAHIEKMIVDLENSISHYKEEYAVLISETQALKAEMEQVKSRVDRSVALLGNLSAENERWSSASQSFESQMSTIVGDVIISSAFLAYGGFFDQQYREALLSKWMNHLDNAGIHFKADLSITDYLSTADERLVWQENHLPADDLCTENAIMLKRFNRYPLVIDPSGQALMFLTNVYKDKKIMVTSFLDDSFLKVLESALRFGNPLLVQDVENLDPILNAVLNKEIRRTGGRVLIRLGGQDIDFSPSFTLYLSTRDPSVQFPPDISSRVTFVNFTVTRGSLQSQCLHQVLKAERPDTDRKRTDLIKLRGEFQLRLRHLEKSLLQALNDSKGNILDDDNVISTLEKLKQEAAEVMKKVEDTDIVMQEVDSVTATYTPLAQACSSIFFCLEQLGLLNHFYQFSLDFFIDIFQYLLHKNPNLKGVQDYNMRLSRIFDDLFKLSYERAARSLLHEDQVVFALQLARIKARSLQLPFDEDGYEYLISPDASHEKPEDLNPSIVEVFGEQVGSQLQILSKKFRDMAVVDAVKQELPVWKQFWEHETPELHIPVSDSLGLGRNVTEFPNLLATRDFDLRKLSIIRAFRPDRLLPSCVEYCESILKCSFPSASDLDLNTIILNEVKSSTPLAFCSVPGHDASKLVEDFASSMSKKIVAVAMGSPEGFTLAENAISNGMKSGAWVLLKNVHLSPSWLSQLEKRLHSNKPHDSFRLFLTMETNPKVPVNLLRLSRILMFEPPPGIKANLSSTLMRIPASRLSKGPVERNRLYFLLAWLHAIVQERLRYVPIGWTKLYEFNESDYDMAMTVVDSWLDDAAGGRLNISPEKIPFDAIKSLLTQTVYGGKIDNLFDQKLLDSFVESLFGPFCFDVNFALANAQDEASRLLSPDATRMEQILAWVGGLPEQQPPSWLGLPSNAERILMASKGLEAMAKVRKMKHALDDYENIAESSGSTAKLSSLQPLWMASVQASVLEWLGFLPESSTTT
ncbi:Cytoplasmic dynein 1 heavy chain 1, partial [Phlyctochytrium bullatum]